MVATRPSGGPHLRPVCPRADELPVTVVARMVAVMVGMMGVPPVWVLAVMVLATV